MIVYIRSMKEITWRDHLPKYNNRLLHNYRIAVSQIIRLGEDDGPILTAERLMNMRSKYTESELQTIDYTAIRQRYNQERRNYQRKKRKNENT